MNLVKMIFIAIASTLWISCNSNCTDCKRTSEYLLEQLDTAVKVVQASENQTEKVITLLEKSVQQGELLKFQADSFLVESMKEKIIAENLKIALLKEKINTQNYQKLSLNLNKEKIMIEKNFQKLDSTNILQDKIIEMQDSVQKMIELNWAEAHATKLKFYNAIDSMNKRGFLCNRCINEAKETLILSQISNLTQLETIKKKLENCNIKAPIDEIALDFLKKVEQKSEVSEFCVSLISGDFDRNEWFEALEQFHICNQ